MQVLHSCDSCDGACQSNGDFLGVFAKTSVVGSSIFVTAGACGLVPKRLDELPFVLGYGRVSERNLSSKKKGV